MGTRHMIAVVNKGKYRVAQYGQWDGYPAGQGISILNFLRDGASVNALKTNCLKCRFVSETEYNDMWKEFGVDINGDGFVDMKTGEKFNQKYPQFNRDVGADILNMVASADNGMKLYDDYEFAADSLFCEWAYVIDFDKNTFEVYEGLNKTPLIGSDRFCGLVCKSNKRRDTKYYPVKLKAFYNLYALPTREEFLQECEGTDE